jgi:uncharacterized damage-inducible protein DinB
MTTAADLLTDAFNRIQEGVHGVLDGLGGAELVARLDPEANTIAWLVWHLTRVQDDHVAALSGREQAWQELGWVDRFGLPFDPDATGYGQTPIDVGKVQPSAPELLAGYHDTVHARTLDFVATLGEHDLARVVDDSWDPPVTLGARLVSVISDDLQHVGQAAIIRGVLERAG